MNYGSEPADQVVRYSLEGAEFALRISGTAAKNFFIFAQAVLHDSKKTHGKTHLIRLLKEQKPLKFFTVDKDRIYPDEKIRLEERIQSHPQNGKTPFERRTFERWQTAFRPN